MWDIQHHLSWRGPKKGVWPEKQSVFFYIPLKSKSMRLGEGAEQKGHSYIDQIKQHHVGATDQRWAIRAWRGLKGFQEWNAEGINRTNWNQPQPKRPHFKTELFQKTEQELWRFLCPKAVPISPRLHSVGRIMSVVEKTFLALLRC